jgi:predicted DNA-binding protein with PD1-like motif
MKYSLATQGRVFVLRLEDGDVVHEVIEAFAMEQGVGAASMIILGGADTGSILTTGPLQDRATPIVAQTKVLESVHEVTGTGTLFPDESGTPVLHLHMALGRGGATLTGCVRNGVRVWHIMEVVLYELLGSSAVRRNDPVTGFDLLVP